jgi:hypothetical protein
MVLDFKLLQNRTRRALEISDETFQLISKNNKLNYYQSCKSHGASRKDMAVWVDLAYIEIETLETRVIIQRGITYDNNVLYRIISQYPGTVPIIDPTGLVNITTQDDILPEKDDANNIETNKSGGLNKKKKSKKNKLNKIKLIFKSNVSKKKFNSSFM